MAKRIYTNENGYLIIAENSDLTDDIRNPSFNIYTEINGNTYAFYKRSTNELILSISYSDILDENGEAYASQETFTNFIEGRTSSIDVTVQDSTTPLVIIQATELIAETTIAIQSVQFEKTFTVADSTGAVIGQHITVYAPSNNRVSFFHITNIVGNIITVGSQIDYAYEPGDFAQFGNSNMAVDGSVTPRIFGIRNPTAQDVELSVDFTRMILSMELDGAGNYDQFGNITALTNGFLCRFVDGEVRNIFNVKTNRDLDNLMFDFKEIAAKPPANEGQSGRFTFEKLGSVIRLKPFEDLEFVVQDNLTLGGTILVFEIVGQGALVTN